MEPGSITRLLQAVQAGAPGAEDRLFDRVYEELQALAAARAARAGRAGSPDGATDLVHDGYARLAGEQFENRRHLFFAYARAMRQILIAAARRRRALKRGGGATAIHLDAARLGPEAAETLTATPRPSAALDADEVDALLERLRAESPRGAEVVTLRFFGGLRDADIAEILGVDARTVRRDWVGAKERFTKWVSA